MGMGRRVGGRWSEMNNEYLAAYGRTSYIASGLRWNFKSFPKILQSGVFGISAFLVFQQESTAGIIIASSRLRARSLRLS
jgi:ATP-binding cassette subfamily C protein